MSSLLASADFLISRLIFALVSLFVHLVRTGVDVHVRSQAPGMLAAIGADAAHIQQPSINLRMGLAAGPQGKMHKVTCKQHSSTSQRCGCSLAELAAHCCVC